MKEILLTLEEKRKIREEFDVSNNTLNNALKCKTKSFLAAKIREAAIEMGGVMRKEKNEETSAVDKQTNNSTNEPEECTN